MKFDRFWFLFLFIAQVFFGVSLEIPHREVATYVALQKEMAKKIPHEADRPVVELRLRETFFSRKIGILGGMGPLSDARIVEKVALKTNAAISLLSIPPPRTFYEICCRICPYLYKVHHFLHQDFDEVYLASNTAHIHYDFLNWLGKGNIIDLTAYVADCIQEKIPDASILILGTEQGRKHFLYENLFSKRGISFISVDDLEQKEIQNVIDQVKRGAQNKDFEEKILQIIDRHKKQTHVVFIACTELSIVLEDSSKELEEMGIECIDSEDLFVQRIANLFQ